MNIGKSIRRIRTENNMSQEGFSKIFFVTRQTVSNWECEKSYPDLNTIVKISDRFGIFLDVLLKEDRKTVNDISEKTALGLKWNKIRQTVFLSVSIIVIFAVVSLSVYGIVWNVRKNRLESHFNDSISLLGFSESDDRYYIMENNGTRYILPHQEMPSFWDFSVNFHAEHLDCINETDLCVADIRISEDMYSITFTDRKSGEDYYVETDEKGSPLNDVNLPEFAEKLYEENTIENIFENGINIYNKVYAE